MSVEMDRACEMLSAKLGRRVTEEDVWRAVEAREARERAMVAFAARFGLSWPPHTEHVEPEPEAVRGREGDVQAEIQARSAAIMDEILDREADAWHVVDPEDIYGSSSEDEDEAQ